MTFIYQPQSDPFNKDSALVVAVIDVLGWELCETPINSNLFVCLFF